MSNTKTIGVVYQIWDDQVGSRIEIAPDSDGLDGLTEIRHVDENGKIGARVFFNREELEKLASLIGRRLSDIAEFESGS